MEQSQHEVGAGVSRAEKAGAALSEILSGIESVSAMMDRIANGASDQRNSVTEIGRQVSEIDNGIEGALERAHAAERSCGHLASQSGALHQEVSRFKLA
jgi:methyl-accepting chemotaxis protein